MGQINVSADQKLIADVDRVAAAVGKTRNDFLRNLMHEGVEAHDAGRLVFARQEGPRLDASISSLAGQLREGITELDRAQRENARIAKRLLDSSNGGEEAARQALGELTKRLVAQRKEANLPFLEQVTELRSDITALPAVVVEMVTATLGPIQDHFAAVAEEARAPRLMRNLIIGREFVREWPVMAAMSVVWLMAGVFFLMLAGNFLPGIGRSLANQFVDDDIALCRQLNGRFGTEECAVPDLRRRNALIAIKLEQRP